MSVLGARSNISRMLPVSVSLMCMQLHSLHRKLTYAHSVLTKAFEMRYPVLKEVRSP